MINSLLGGRPMRKEGFAFTDVVSGQPVYRFVDRIGRRWLAENSWSLFRVDAADTSVVDRFTDLALSHSKAK